MEPQQRRDTSKKTSPERDAALASALLAGDPRAAARAWTLLSPLVQRVVGRYFVGRTDVEDLCQEVFLRFFSRIDELRDPRALRNFLIGISLGVAQNELRRARVRRRTQVTPGDDLPEGRVEPFDIEGREALGRLLGVLALVDVEERVVFVMRHVHQMELPEIAASRGLTVPMAKRRVARVNRRIALRMRREPALSDYLAGGAM